MKYKLLLIVLISQTVFAQKIERVRAEITIGKKTVTGYVDQTKAQFISQTLEVYPDNPQMIQELMALKPSPVLYEGSPTEPAQIQLNTKHKIKANIGGRTFDKKKVKCRTIQSFCDQVLEGKILVAELINSSTPVAVYQSFDNTDEELIRKVYFVFHGKRMLYALYEEQSLTRLIKKLKKKTKFSPSLPNKNSDQIITLIDQYNEQL